MCYWRVSDDHVFQFLHDRFPLVPSLLDSEEKELLERAAHGDGPLREQTVLDHVDPSGNLVQLLAWNHPGDDI